MVMQEHEGNRFVNERTDVERYLFRIIRRYFDTENIYSQASIESIIVESLTRLKREIYSNKDKYVFSLNERTGHLLLTIQDFGGEYAFEKNDTFNKDFGSVSDAICEGDDDRLFDRRKPLEHVHDIGDISTLRKRLDVFLDKLKDTHYHSNQNILDMLTYTNNNAKIDLIVIEETLSRIEFYFSYLNQLKTDLFITYNSNIEAIGCALCAAQEDLKNARNFASSAIEWVEKTKKQIKDIIKDFDNETVLRLALYVKKSDLQSLMEYIQSTHIMTVSGEIPIPDGIPSFTLSTGNNTEETIISVNSAMEFLYKTGNWKAKMFFRYDKDGKSCTTPLPYVYNTPGGYCVIQGYREDNGIIHVDANIVSKITDRIGPENMYDERTVIFSSSGYKDYYAEVKDGLTQQYCTLCCVDNDFKKEFVKGIISDPAQTYFINAFKEIGEYSWFSISKDNTETLLPYTESTFENGVKGNNICMDGQDKLYTTDGVVSKNGYIAEYTIQMISDYFENPRIYYQIYEEGI